MYTIKSIKNVPVNIRLIDHTHGRERKWSCTIVTFLILILITKEKEKEKERMKEGGLTGTNDCK